MDVKPRQTRRERRKEGSAGAPTRGEETGAARGQCQNSIGWPIARPPHERTPRRLRRSFTIRVVDDARVAGGIAADGRAALHVVDDARVAGGIAADGMNINNRPRRRVAGKTPMLNAASYGIPCFLYGPGVHFHVT